MVLHKSVAISSDSYKFKGLQDHFNFWYKFVVFSMAILGCDSLLERFMELTDDYISIVAKGYKLEEVCRVETEGFKGKAFILRGALPSWPQCMIILSVLPTREAHPSFSIQSA